MNWIIEKWLGKSYSNKFPNELYQVKCIKCERTCGEHSADAPYGNAKIREKSAPCSGFSDDDFGEWVVKERKGEEDDKSK